MYDAPILQVPVSGVELRTHWDPSPKEAKMGREGKDPMFGTKLMPIAACIAMTLAASVPYVQAQSVSVWLTTDDQRTLMQEQSSVVFIAGSAPDLPTIFLDDHARYQTIEGFGASMTDSSAYLMNQKIPPAQLPRVMQSLFDHAQGIGVSFLRNPMGASDLARTAYSYDDLAAGATDPDLASFSIAHDNVDILPLLKQAKAINPKITMMGSPWSPPGWMKTSGSMIGGTLLPSAYPAFANYFVKYLQAYAAEGVPVDYISIQNEPLYVPTDYPGMSVPETDAVTLLRDHVLPALTANNLTAKVLVYDHNWDNTAYALTVLADPKLANSTQIAGTAWHWYGGPPGAMTTLHNAHPGLRNYVTEASGGTWIADEVKTDFEQITHSMRNWSSSYVKWGLALDENRGPHYGGCGTCTGLITVNQSTGAVTPTIDYYTLGHFSKFVLPGAVRIWSSNAPGLIDAAFTNPDGQRVLVAYNDSAASRSFQVVSKGRSFLYTLPALGGATFTWTEPAGATHAIRPHDVRAPRYPVAHRNGVYSIGATSQRIMASSYTGISNFQTEQCSDADGGFNVGYSASGSWVEYRNIDFGSGVQSVDVRLANPAAGGTLHFHLDSLTGPQIAQLVAPVTGGWQTWQTVNVPVTGAKGLRNLYVVYSGSSSEGGLVNLNWFQFK